MAPGDGGLPAWHFTTQLDGPSEPHIDRKTVKGIGFMEEEQNHAAKGQMVALMQAGQAWQEAARMAGVQISRSAAYRLLQKVRTESAKRACEMAGMDTLPNCADRATMAQRLLPSRSRHT